MPRAPSISYEQFRAVASTIKAEGQDLTFRLLRERLGGGSYEVLNRYIELFGKEQVAGMPGMPTNILSGAHALYEQAKADVRRDLAAEHAQRVAELDGEHAQLQTEREQLVQQVAHAQGAAATLTEQLGRVERELATERERKQALACEVARLQSGLAGAHESRTVAAAQLAEQITTLRAALTEATERADLAEKRFLLELDHLRQALGKMEASRRQEFDELSKQLSISRSQCAEATAEAARWQSRAQSLKDLQQTAASVEATIHASIEGAQRALGGQADALASASVQMHQAQLTPVVVELRQLVATLQMTLVEQKLKSKGAGKEPKK